MRIYPAPHYTMGGLWVDYDLMTTIPGLYALGEANFSDHGANRLGASALMQGLADGYFVLPATIGGYLADFLNVSPAAHRRCRLRRRRGGGTATGSTASWRSQGSRPVDWFHRELGKIMIEHCGMSRNRTGLEKALAEIPALKAEFEPT